MDGSERVLGGRHIHQLGLVRTKLVKLEVTSNVTSHISDCIVNQVENKADKDRVHSGCVRLMANDIIMGCISIWSSQKYGGSDLLIQ